jgi:sorting nexin-29
MPSDWQRSIICLIYKKVDKLVCNNYKGISLLCVPYKHFRSILRGRLEPLAERIMGEYQAGIRKGRSTIDHIFTVKQILEKCWEINIDLFQIFTDFQQAYDSFDKAMIGYIMREMEIGSFFQVKQDLKQGEGLAPFLFNLVLEYVIRKLQVDTIHTLEYKSAQIVGYADDINFMGRSLRSVEEMFEALEMEGKEVGLK